MFEHGAQKITHFAPHREIRVGSPGAGVPGYRGDLIGGRTWLAEHPEHNPWAPLDLRDPPGWATAAKLSALNNDVPKCRAVLERSEVAYTALPPTGEGACARPDRTRLDAYPHSPGRPATTCTIGVAVQLWRRDALTPAAAELFGSKVERIEHLGDRLDARLGANSMVAARSSRCRSAEDRSRQQARWPSCHRVTGDGDPLDSAENMETLANTSPERLLNEFVVNKAAFDFLQAALGLAKRPLLVLTSDDTLASHTDPLVAAVRARSGQRTTAAHVATDHSWSDRRIELQARIIRWLRTLESRIQASKE